VLYRVQVGAFSARERADGLAAALKQDGFQPYVIKEGGLYKVRAGAFRERRLAEQLADRLRAKGYQVAILR
jgi:N-acetylmuramoyl-L-alanine amidase